MAVPSVLRGTHATTRLFLAGFLIAPAPILEATIQPPHLQAESSSQRSLEQALEAARAGEFQRAREILEAALAREPGRASLHYNHGYVLEQLGDGVGAIAAYWRAVGIDPALALAWENLAVALLRSNRLTEAEQAVGAALRHHPENGSLRYHRALTQFLRGGNLPESAVEDAERARALGFERPHLYAMLGRVAAARGEHDRARELLQRGLELDPRDRVLRREMGLTLAAQGDLAEAINWFRRVLAEHPADPQLSVDLGRLLLRTGLAREAAEVVDRSIERHPEDPALLYLLARAQQSLGDPAAAETFKRFQDVTRENKAGRIPK
jgi:tetratricopeptide (TPR) repeat protein